MDIMLDKDGDLYITEKGDILLENSVAQQIRIKVLWFANEWRWMPEEGLPYLENVFIKKPNLAAFENELRRAIFDVPEVVSVKDIDISYDKETRLAIISYVAKTDLETIREEVEIKWQITE